MQPVQDLTVEDRVSRTQYQYSLEDPDSQELATWTPRFVSKLESLPELRDVASDKQDQGLQVRLVIDRDTASRLGITPTLIDNTLYDAFGQRQISTMFTQANQYHVVLEVKPNFQNRPQDLKSIYIRSPTSGEVPLSLHCQVRTIAGPVGDQPSGSVLGGDYFVQPGSGRLPGRCGPRDRPGQEGPGNAPERPGQL